MSLETNPPESTTSFRDEVSATHNGLKTASGWRRARFSTINSSRARNRRRARATIRVGARRIRPRSSPSVCQWTSWTPSLNGPELRMDFKTGSKPRGISRHGIISRHTLADHRCHDPNVLASCVCQLRGPAPPDQAQARPLAAPVRLWSEPRRLGRILGPLDRVHSSPPGGRSNSATSLSPVAPALVSLYSIIRAPSSERHTTTAAFAANSGWRAA